MNKVPLSVALATTTLVLVGCSQRLDTSAEPVVSDTVQRVGAYVADNMPKVGPPVYPPVAPSLSKAHANLDSSFRPRVGESVRPPDNAERSGALPEASPGRAACQDASECGDDHDCSSGYLCRCDERGRGLCVTAGCRLDEDCPEGRCVQTVLRHGVSCAENELSYQCTSSADECVPPMACSPEQPCGFDQSEGRFRCMDTCRRL